MTHLSPDRKVNWGLLAGLRFLLAWIVLCNHLSLYSPNRIPWAGAFSDFGGKASVIGFLLVSGYSIAASLARNSREFYRRRFLRIYPLYLLAVVLAIALAWAANQPVAAANSVFEPTTWKVAIGNLLLLQTFLVKPVPLNGPVWSLAVEVFFYALAPVLWRTKRSWLLVVVAISGMCYLLPRHDDWGPVYFVLSRLVALKFAWCWILGLMFFQKQNRLITAVGLAGTILVAKALTQYEPYCYVTYLVSLLLVMGANRVAFPKRISTILTYLGDLSYPLYLFHFPVLAFGYVYLQIRSSVLLTLLAVAVSVVAFHTIDGYLKPRFFAPLLRRSLGVSKPQNVELAGEAPGLAK